MTSPVCRCFCVDCLDILVGPGVSNSARYQDPWRCYMCQPLFSYGALKRRHDWNLKLQEFFINDNGQEFVSPRLVARPLRRSPAYKAQRSLQNPTEPSHHTPS